MKNFMPYEDQIDQWWYSLGDRFLQSAPVEHAKQETWNALMQLLADKLNWLSQAFHQVSPEIITVGIVFCGLLLMMTGDFGKWMGRATFLFWLGVCDRLLR